MLLESLRREGWAYESIFSLACRGALTEAFFTTFRNNDLTNQVIKKWGERDESLYRGLS